MARGDHDNDTDVQRAELLKNKDFEMDVVQDQPGESRYYNHVYQAYPFVFYAQLKWPPLKNLT